MGNKNQVFGHDAPQVVVYSFGFLHDTYVLDSRPHLVADVRTLFRDPHHDPAFRELTGHSKAVRVRVLSQPGAVEFVNGQAAAIAAVLPGDTGNQAGPITMAIGCAGGRHRSVVLAQAIADRLTARGLRVEVRHLHIDRPVVSR
jgi:UPF0042 nucleotide-binding protein